MSDPEGAHRRAVGTIAAVVALVLLGLWLLFGGDASAPSTADTTNPDTSDEATSGGSSPPATGGEATQTSSPDHLPSPSPSPSPRSAQPSPRAEPHETPESPAPTSQAPDDVDSDPHIHRPPTQEEIDAAPAPDFGGDFPSDVPPELAAELAALAWEWLRPTLAEDQWTGLELVQYGVVANAVDDKNQPTDVTVAIGYSGVDVWGNAGSGGTTKVWVTFVEGAWKVTGRTDWSPFLD